MNKIISLLLFAMTTLAVNAAEPIVVDLWPQGAPTDNGLSGDETGSPGWVMNVSHPVLYVYPAAQPSGKTILMCPGGAYIGLAMNHEGVDMADWFNAMGITYAVLKYRMPNGHSEVPLDDAEQAMRLLREHAAEWGIDPSRIGVAGASAGGHLATTLATKYRSPETRPAFQVLFYPVVTAQPGVTHKGSVENLCGPNATEADIALYSNELHVDANTPPAFIMLSADDTTVPVENSIRYFQALVKAGVPASLHVYPTGNHGWGYRDSFPCKPQWTMELDRWLR